MMLPEIHEDEADEVMALVREPTDLNVPEEDVLIEGGTGENNTLNGLYFKMTGTYGIPLYRLVKKEGLVTTNYAQRYLFRDAKSCCWVISGKPNGGVQNQKGMAFVEDDAAERPSEVRAQWYVWHTASKMLKSPEEEEHYAMTEEAKGNLEPRKQLDLYPVNVLKVKSIVGFELTCMATPMGPTPGLMLRHGSQFYGRPVYEGENGSQFLYWMVNGGTYDTGIDMENDTTNPKKLFEKSGYWAVSKAVGIDYSSNECSAYCPDDAVIPPYFNDDEQKASAFSSKWYVRKSPGYRGFVTDPKFRLRIEKWNRTNDLTAFDQDDIEGLDGPDGALAMAAAGYEVDSGGGVGSLEPDEAKKPLLGGE